RDRRLFERGPSDEPRVDLAPSRGLGRSALSGGRRRISLEDERDRPVRIVRDRMHAVAYERKICRDRERRTHLSLWVGLDALAVAVSKLDHQTRLPEDAVVRDGRGVVRHLERRSE